MVDADRYEHVFHIVSPHILPPQRILARDHLDQNHVRGTHTDSSDLRGWLQTCKELKKHEQSFLAHLWNAACVHLMIQFLQGARQSPPWDSPQEEGWSGDRCIISNVVRLNAHQMARRRHRSRCRWSCRRHQLLLPIRIKGFWNGSDMGVVWVARGPTCLGGSLEFRLIPTCLYFPLAS